MSKIVVVGSSNTDMMVRANQMPIPGETVLGEQFYMNSGGKGANQAVAVARLGGAITFITKIGKDIFGFEFLKQFKEEGIDTEYVAIHKSKPTGVALITVSNQAENSIVVAPGANAALKKKDIDKAIIQIQDADIILIQLEIPIKIVHYVIALAKEHGKKVILNPAPARDLEDQLYSNLYLITPNETEAELLTGIAVTDVDSARSAAKVLKGKGVQNVIITMGSQGAYIYTDTLDVLVPGCKVDAKDTTAAGDTFNGALAVGLGQGMTLVEAVTLANKAASFSVMKFGAQASIPFLHEIESGGTSTTSSESIAS